VAVVCRPRFRRATILQIGSGFRRAGLVSLPSWAHNVHPGAGANGVRHRGGHTDQGRCCGAPRHAEDPGGPASIPGRFGAGGGKRPAMVRRCSPQVETAQMGTRSGISMPGHFDRRAHSCRNPELTPRIRAHSWLGEQGR
jgi:hypothetical protein